MARLRGHRTLDYAQPLFVRRAVLTVAGQTFAQGDVLPWRDLKLDARKVHQLWMGRRVGHELVDDRNGAESVSALVSPAPTAPPAAPVQPDSFTAGGVIVARAEPKPKAEAERHGRSR